MGNEQRKHPRVPCKVKVIYEFTSWKDTNLSQFKKPIEGETVDISEVGLGIPHLVEINHSLATKLISGKKKVKLSFSLEEGEPPIRVYARLVWVDLTKEVKEHHTRGGMAFVDISTPAYLQIKKYVEAHLK